jgi:hypothetical protein
MSFNFGRSAAYSVLAAAGITNTGNTVINDLIGSRGQNVANSPLS